MLSLNFRHTSPYSVILNDLALPHRKVFLQLPKLVKYNLLQIISLVAAVSRMKQVELLIWSASLYCSRVFRTGYSELNIQYLSFLGLRSHDPYKYIIH